MARQIFIGLVAEGPTDIRFLKSIVSRTFQYIALNECDYDLDLQFYPVNVSKIGLDFPELALKAWKEGVETIGMTVLAIHTDADRETYETRRRQKIIPAQEALEKHEEGCSRYLTPIIPVRMIEAWMLADKRLLKEEMGTDKSDQELEIARDPETIADPKSVIEKAIRIATADKPKRRQRLSISDLYSIIGDKVSLSEMERLDSYRKFQDEVRDTFRNLNCLH